MKSMIVALALSMLSVSAFAESYATTAELPAGSVVEALFAANGAPVCPPDYVVAKKYCFSKADWRFHACGTFCNPTKVPPSRH